jgi:hypothetical protein
LDESPQQELQTEAMAIRSVRLTDGWATRRLALCVRQLDTLVRPELVAHLTSPGR